MVIYEAARAIVNMTNVTHRELAPAISVLQLFLSSPKPTMRFAAVRTLNKVSIQRPVGIRVQYRCIVINIDTDVLVLMQSV